MTDSIRRSLASLEQREGWPSDSAAWIIPDDVHRLDPDERGETSRRVLRGRAAVSLAAPEEAR